MDDIAAVCCYFNPCDYKSKEVNYYHFQRNLHDIPLYTVELALENKEHILYNRYDNVIPVRSDSILWHKENLLNIGIKNVADRGYKYVALLDADIVYQDVNWWQTALQLLQEYTVLHGFRGVKQFFSRNMIDAYSGIYHAIENKVYNASHPGASWIGHTSFFLNNPLYDKCIVGGGDAVTLAGFLPESIYQNTDGECIPRASLPFRDEYKNNYVNWIEHTRQKMLKEKISYLPHDIFVLPHGSCAKRDYGNRHNILYNFNPLTDVEYNEYGVLEFTLCNLKLEDEIKKYFYFRQEDEDTKMTKVIGFSGKKQSGKTSSALWLFGSEMCAYGLIDKHKINKDGKLVVPAMQKDGNIVDAIFDPFSTDQHVRDFLRNEMDDVCKIYSFADSLKEMCVELFGLSYKQVHGSNEDKNTLVKYKWSDFPTNILKQCHDNIPKELDSYMTARDFMKFIGNLMRLLDEDIWVKACIDKILREKPAMAIIPDIRYENEVQAVQRIGGFVIRFTRQIDDDSHVSETALDNYDKFDAIIDNRNMSLAEQIREVFQTLKDANYVDYEG